MNRILAAIVGVAVLALVVLAVIVFTSTPPASVQIGVPRLQAETPAPAATTPPAESATPADSNVAAAPDATPAPLPADEMKPQTPEAKDRFDAWAKPLRDDGLTVTADRVSEAGETISVAGLVIAAEAETPGWRWTAERGVLYDRGLFHFQAGGKTTFAITTGPGQEMAWSGKADGVGIALQRDARDVLSQSLIIRMNGVSLARDGEAEPTTLADMQLRILLKGGTGLLPEGTDVTLRLTDLRVPQMAGTTLGTSIKSFTTEFAIDKAITGYSIQQMIDFFTRGETGVPLDTVALDWGSLHFTGKGSLTVDAAGQPTARLDVNVTEALTLLDAIAAGGGKSETLSANYAALLQELGKNPDEAAVPMAVSFKDGSIVLQAPAGDITLPVLPPPAAAPAPTPAAPAAPAAPAP